jgi:hypothetical protein
MRINLRHCRYSKTWSVTAREEQIMGPSLPDLAHRHDEDRRAYGAWNRCFQRRGVRVHIM